ncbi:hypothetical protein ACIQUX_35215 [Streptomyces sp. NPDC101133]|uniref:hypothetical protein n=1 Tax=Streptomyces sp. NPDC101133 TaxID=3366111 RepID=UPI003803D410
MTLKPRANPVDDEVNAMLTEWGKAGWEPVNHTTMADHEGFPIHVSFLFRHRVV